MVFLIASLNRGVYSTLKPDQPEMTNLTVGSGLLPTEPDTFGLIWWVSSPKTRVTRLNHKINKIQWHSKVFQQKFTNTGDTFAFLTKSYLKSTRSRLIQQNIGNGSETQNPMDLNQTIRPLLRVGFGFVFHPPEFFVSGPIREQTQLGLTCGHPYLLTCPEYHTTLTTKKKKRL